MLLSHFTDNWTIPLPQSDFNRFCLVDISPIHQTKLTTLSLASNFGVWSSSEQTGQAKENAHVMEKHCLYKVNPFIHNAGLQLLDIFKNSVNNK